MAKYISVRGAQPHRHEEDLEPVYITITDCFSCSYTDEGAAQIEHGFKHDAEALFSALLEALPGGTFCHLLGLMLQEKASHFVVSHKQEGKGGV